MCDYMDAFLYTAMSNCPRSTSVIVMLTTDTPRLSPRPTPTPSYTTTTRVVAMVTDSPIPTTEGQSTIEHTLGTDSQIPGNTSTGLIAGIAIPVFVVGLILVLVIVVLLIWRTKKRKLQQTHESKWYTEIILIYLHVACNLTYSI